MTTLLYELPNSTDYPSGIGGKTYANLLSDQFGELCKRQPIRNRIVNPCMKISQENGNSAGTTTGYYPADQWSVLHSSDGAISSQRVQSATPAGALDRLRVSVTTADASLSAAQYLMVTQRLEGSRMADFLFGSASARAGVIRAGLKFPAGTYGVAIKNAADNRAFVGTVTISGGEANTDVVKEIAFTGDTTGTWPTTDVHGWTLVFTLAAGANYQGATGWSATDDTTTSSQTNGLSSNTNVFEIFDVGLKMDVDGIGQYGAFEVPDPVAAYRDCRRHYRSDIEPPMLGVCGSGGTTGNRLSMQLDPPMRTAPSHTLSGNLPVYDGSATSTFTAITTSYSSVDRAEIDFSGASGLTAYRLAKIYKGAGTAKVISNSRM